MVDSLKVPRNNFKKFQVSKLISDENNFRSFDLIRVQSSQIKLVIAHFVYYILNAFFF